MCRSSRLVGAAALAAPFTAYLSLVAATLIDWGLYLCMPEVVVCYVCEAQHRGAAGKPRHPRFDREIAEHPVFGREYRFVREFTFQITMIPGRRSST